VVRAARLLVVESLRRNRKRAFHQFVLEGARVVRRFLHELRQSADRLHFDLGLADHFVELRLAIHFALELLQSVELARLEAHLCHLFLLYRKVLLQGLVHVGGALRSRLRLRRHEVPT